MNRYALLYEVEKSSYGMERARHVHAMSPSKCARVMANIGCCRKAMCSMTASSSHTLLGSCVCVYIFPYSTLWSKGTEEHNSAAENV